MIALRTIVSRENFKNFEIPEEFGNKFEIILLPVENGELRMESEEQHFLASAYNSVIEDNKREDQIWMKYQEENGFCKNILAQESEDIWNDV